MSNVAKITKQLKSLRVKSEARRADRAAAGGGQNEGRTPKPSQGGEGGSAQSSQTNRIRSVKPKVHNKLVAFRLERGGTPSGQVRALATLMKQSVLKSQKHSVFVSNVKSFKKRFANAELPYKEGVDHENIPVVSSIAHDKSRLSTEVSSRAVMTEYGPGIEFSGEEYLFSAATSSNDYSMGNTIVAFPLNPRVLTTPRLRLFSQLYTRFIFKDAELLYEHSAGAQNNGSLCMFGVYDPTVNPCMKPGDPLIGYATNRRAAQTGVFEDVKVRMDDSHFKDMLFLEADDDLRWTLQGILYAVSVGTIPVNLELGQFKLRYKVIMANDDLDEDEEMSTRTFSGTMVTAATGVTGAEVTLTNSGSWPAGKYWCTVRANPSSTFNVYKDVDAYQQNDAAQAHSILKGCGFYMIIPASGAAKIYHCPDVFSENGLNSGKGMVHNGSTLNGTSVPLQIYRLSD